MRTSSIATKTIRAGQGWHAMLAETQHDDVSRQMFVRSLMGQLDESMGPGNGLLWERHVRPGFIRTKKRDAAHVGEIRRALMDQPYTQYWSAMKRCSREMMTDATGPMVERQLPALIERARRYRVANDKLGSLELDPGVAMPRYMTEIENHAKPGAYHTELTADDVFSGAEYDHSFYIAARPGLLNVDDKSVEATRATRASGYGPYIDDMGACLAAWTRKNLADLRPTAILDMGCTVGNSTLPWADAYPDAEVHAIDTAAPCLRYAHARAESLRRKVHFSQQNCEKTRYPDASFDIIASHLLIHELTLKALHTVFRECHRLLKPGGYMLHLDVPPAQDMDMMANLFPLDWNTHYNVEPFITKLTELDLTEVATACGFAPGASFRAYAPSQVRGSTAKRHFFAARR